jgi:predicted phage terminase large subunit-like protein
VPSRYRHLWWCRWGWLSKSWALLLDALRYAALEPVPDFGAVIFRRTSPQITAQGGLWDESGRLYSLAGGKPNQTRLEWSWPQHRTRIRFSHMQYESDMFGWQGSQIPLIGFDELTHFTQEQFFYMLSRNRSMCGIKPRIRATTNPDAESWAKVFLAPWVDDTYPDPAASGEMRYFVRERGNLVWYRRRADIPETQRRDAKSVTFIAASIYDNPQLLQANPEYLANLKALPLVERERLLEGNWNIRPSGNLFKRHWFRIIDVPPAHLPAVRYWDLAGTEKTTRNDPDWTVAVKMGKHASGYMVLDVIRVRDTPKAVKDLILQTALLDGEDCPIWIEQEGGSAGKYVASDLTAALDGFEVHTQKPTTNKEFRARPFSSQCEAGNVAVVRGHWNDAYLNTLCAFPNPAVHDDDVDASSGAYTVLSGRKDRVPMVTLSLGDAGGISGLPFALPDPTELREEDEKLSSAERDADRRRYANEERIAQTMDQLADLMGWQARDEDG